MVEKHNCDITAAWADIICCPHCQGPFEANHRELSNDPSLKCSTCAAVFPDVAGSYDFAVVKADVYSERQHYEHAYSSRQESCSVPFDTEYWAHRWKDPHWPEGPMIMERLGDLEDKLVLCLGNGASPKELHFLTLGARLVLSDLSLSGVLAIKSSYNLGEMASRAAFHAIDACRIPVKDNCLDVVYGYEFVHHLPDLNVFLHEVHRVLKPGGLCIFFDPAYSPIWQTAKRTFLWPLMRVSHLLRERSPEDIRATYQGGYREDVLKNIGLRHAFSEAFFDRVMFFQYLLTNGVGSLFGWSLPRACYRIPGAIGRSMDKLLTNRVDLLRRSRIGLVWGFQK